MEAVSLPMTDVKHAVTAVVTEIPQEVDHEVVVDVAQPEADAVKTAK